MGANHTYRPDIDGLRAVAVLAVLAFHGFSRVVPGGFVGVDVFFVISGFLISRIILDDLRSDSFSFRSFYWRRVRRIFPALIVVLAATLALGWLLLLPNEFEQLGKHVAAGAGFLSNIALWREAGYFDTAAELKPLLHLWSLGVEEQYYLVWPFLLFITRGRVRATFYLIGGLGALAFAANISLLPEHQSASFYLPVTRFWELMVGSALAVVQRHPAAEIRLVSDAQAWCGALLILGSILALSGDSAFPGWLALLPVLGAAQLIAAGPDAWVNRNILSRRTMVSIGVISYPLYLWHWPLIAFDRIVTVGEPTVVRRAVLLALSVFLASATYHLIERRIRRPSAVTLTRVTVPALGVAMAVVAAAGVAAQQQYVLPHSASVARVAEISRASVDWEPSGNEVIAGDTPRAVLFLGDSHMQQYWPRIRKLADERKSPIRTVIFKTAAGCAPVPGIERSSTKCNDFVTNGFRRARAADVDAVVIAASWAGFMSRTDYYRVDDADRTTLTLSDPAAAWVFAQLGATLRDLVTNGKQVVIVLSSPRGAAFDPRTMIERTGLTLTIRARSVVTRSDLSAVTGGVDDRLRKMAAAVGARVIDPTEYLCNEASCPTSDGQGRPLYKDATHLRASVARERFSAIDEFVYIK